MTGLTEEEASIYDRQIRLWGLEAQHRLQSSRILVVGMRAVAAEVCKDLALAGVGALTIWDDAEVTEQDLGSNFLLRASDKGSPVQ